MLPGYRQILVGVACLLLALPAAGQQVRHLGDDEPRKVAPPETEPEEPGEPGTPDEPGGDEPADGNPDEGISPDQDGPPPADPIDVTGRERLAWSQVVVPPQVIDDMVFVALVNGERVPLDDARCEPQAGPQGHACSAALPRLTPGRHWLSLRAIVRSSGVEGLASDELTLLVRVADADPGAGVTSSDVPSSPAAPQPSSPSDQPSSPPALQPLSPPVDGFSDIADLAVLPAEAGLLVAEQAGRVIWVHHGTPRPLAVTLPDLVTDAERGVLSMATYAAGADSATVAVAYTTPEGVRISRFLFEGGAASLPVVVADALPLAAGPPRVSVRFAADGTLRVLLDGDEPAAGDLGSLEGKLLRLNADGTTPRDQRAASPVEFGALHDPAGMAWSSADVAWVLDAGSDGAPRVLRLHQASPRPDTPQPTAYALPDGFAASAMARLPGDNGETRLVLAPGAGDIALSLTVTVDGQVRETAWWPLGIDAPVQALAAVGDRLFVATRHAVHALAPPR